MDRTDAWLARVARRADGSRHSAGNVRADRGREESTKFIAALAGDPKGTTALLAERLKPVAIANPAALDRIFRELDDKAFAVRERATRELAELGPGAIAGVRDVWRNRPRRK